MNNAAVGLACGSCGGRIDGTDVGGSARRRQIIYATSRFGLFETFRDKIAEHRPVGAGERVAAGLASGACAALISCPAEVALGFIGLLQAITWGVDCPGLCQCSF